jgi:hypothetical protein
MMTMANALKTKSAMSQVQYPFASSASLSAKTRSKNLIPSSIIEAK